MTSLGYLEPRDWNETKLVNLLTFLLPQKEMNYSIVTSNKVKKKT